MRLFLATLTLVLALPLACFAAATQVVKEGELHRVVRDFLLKKSQGVPAELKVRRVGLAGDVTLPAGEVSYEVIAPERWEGWGHASLALVIRVDDRVRKNLSVPVEVEALTDMVLATRTLERGEVLQPGDLAVGKRDLAKVGGRFVRNPAEVVGLRVKSSIRANAPLRGDYLERVPIVKSGQLVTIVAENEAVRITAGGKAKGSGALGDTIMVQNLSSQKEIAGRIVDASTVQVDF